MDLFLELLNNLFILANEASPFLILGLVIAGLMKTWVPTQILSKHLGSGNNAIVKAAFVGAPLPLCSCGVIPVATQLKRSGASAPATSSFLVATPETGVDSVSVSYALLGPIMAIYRPITAILSAIFTGFLVSTIKEDGTIKPKANEASSIKSCCSSKNEASHTHQQVEETTEKTSCCASKTQPKTDTMLSKTLLGIKYAFGQLIDDLIVWLFIGLLFATLVKTFLPPEFLVSYGSGITAMLLMIAISIPMYICATASTPIAAGFILAGISPGTALVFMMAGPATNISTLGVIKNEMGKNVLVRYLLGISVSAISFGLLLDFGLAYFGININEQMSHNHEMLPFWFSTACTATLVIMAIKPIRRLIIK
ncbi:SO_0444 family Cu/Zn efflux transporter [Thalassomonas sp. M1454]|uniref:SO_0444 family Cu/Zn efflux transporter n=1 Tax=Thalassomonas sp. M1454 TaxID=2594477 RepID=UPI0011815A7B|nr:SO_0444 family Cu/Zn efflux transporter [Thalassomonas sp. M1454]TRX57472.1 permease [Thalassomonas sp. M1454]